MTNKEFISWRSRLGLSQEAAADLLGVHRITIAKWEISIFKISRQTQLAYLACELAYIAADQFVKDHPSLLTNFSLKNHSEGQGKQRIREGILNEGKNILKHPILITLLPESFIYLNGASAKQESQYDQY